MAATKTVTVLDNNVTLTAGAANHTSSTWDLADGYGGELMIRNTNGATGPTVAMQCQVWVSGDNSNFFKFGGALIATLGNGVVTSWSFPIPAGVKYCYVISGSNTGQDTVVRVEGTEIVSIA